MKILNQNNFKHEISNGVVVVDMYADWCGPCRALSPILQEMDGKIEGVTFAKLNVDEANSIASEYGVVSIPTVIIFKNGQEVNRIIGLYPRQKYEEEIKSALGE